MSDSQSADKSDGMESSKPPVMESFNKKMTHISRRSVNLDDYDLCFYRAKRADVRGWRFENKFKNYYCGVYSHQNNDANMKILRSILRSSKRLQEFSFGVDDEEDISDVGLNAISESIKRIPGLTKVHLDLQRCSEITHKGLRKLGHALKHHSLLTSVALKFPGCERIGSGLPERLGIILKNLKSLQHLELDFHKNYNEEWQIGYLGELLKRLTCLKSIALDFSNSFGLECRFLPRILKKFISLERLSLKLYWCTRFNDATLENMSQTLRTLESLQELCLDLGACNKLTDTGINSLCEVLKDMACLKCITLVFSDPFNDGSKITDAGILNIGQTLKHLISLRKISLDFSRLDISDAGLLNLGQLLATCTHLKSLEFNFEYCKNLSKTAQDEFYVMFNGFCSQGQRDLKINFWNS